MHGSMCPLLPGWEVNLCYAGLYGLLLLGPVDLVPTVGQELAAHHSHEVPYQEHNYHVLLESCANADA
jgi:hypothetical protein